MKLDGMSATIKESYGPFKVGLPGYISDFNHVEGTVTFSAVLQPAGVVVDFHDIPIYYLDIPGIQVTFVTEKFTKDQWWFKEIEDALRNGTPDQQRALAVLENLLGQINRGSYEP